MRFEGASEAGCDAEAGRVAAALRAAAGRGPVQVLGPAPSPLSRLRGLWRFQVLLKSRERAALRAVVAALPRGGPGDVRRIVDVDPINML